MKNTNEITKNECYTIGTGKSFRVLKAQKIINKSKVEFHNIRTFKSETLNVKENDLNVWAGWTHEITEVI